MRQRPSTQDQSLQLGLTGRLARFSATYRYYMVLASGIGDVLTMDMSVTNNPESEQADTLIENRLRGPAVPEEFVIVQSQQLTVDDPQFAALVADILASVRALDGAVLNATSFHETGIESLFSADRHTTIIPITLAGEINDAAETAGPLVVLVEEAEAPEGFEVLVAGQGSIGPTPSTKSPSATSSMLARFSRENSFRSIPNPTGRRRVRSTGS